MAEKALIAYSKEEEEKKEEVDGSWSELPLELLCLVSSHLLAGDFITFRAVCKSWRSSTSLIRPLSPLSMDSAHSLFPCLMSADYYKCRFYHPTYYGTDDHMDILELLGACIRFSKYGSLLLTRDDGSVFFFNPFTKAKVELPRYTKWKAFETMCFSAPPTSSNCFVLGICCPLFFGFIKREEESWTFPDFTGRRFQVSNCNPILCKGLCYCLDVYGNIGVFDPNGNSSQWTVYDLRTSFSEKQFSSIYQSYLVETDDGKLLAVFLVEEDETPIYIYEVTLLNLMERVGKRLWHMSRRRVRSLENKMMYISLGGSFLEPGGTTTTNNKIYLPVIQDNKNVFYSLNFAMYKAFPSDYLSKLPYHVQELQNCCWIKRTPELTFEQDIEWY